MHYDVTGFNIENDGITFCEGIGDYGALISIGALLQRPTYGCIYLNKKDEREYVHCGDDGILIHFKSFDGHNLFHCGCSALQ